jgi:hypothetical protein
MDAQYTSIFCVPAISIVVAQTLKPSTPGVFRRATPIVAKEPDDLQKPEQTPPYPAGFCMFLNEVQKGTFFARASQTEKTL